MKVIIFTTPTCGYCRQAKLFLQSHGVKFQEKDVSADRNAANEMVGRSGQMGVPVILIDDEVIIGFDRPKLELLLTKATALKPVPFGLRVADASRMASKTGPVALGAYVGKVRGSSPADRAGLREGDVITAVNSDAIRDAGDLERVVAALASGSRVSIQFVRGGSTQTVEISV